MALADAFLPRKERNPVARGCCEFSYLSLLFLCQNIIYLHFSVFSPMYGKNSMGWFLNYCFLGLWFCVFLCPVEIFACSPSYFLQVNLIWSRKFSYELEFLFELENFREYHLNIENFWVWVKEYEPHFLQHTCVFACLICLEIIVNKTIKSISCVSSLCGEMAGTAQKNCKSILLTKTCPKYDMCVQ